MDSDEDFFISNTVLNTFFKKKTGIHPLNKKRKTSGEFRGLYFELRQHPDKFYNYARMPIESFDYILAKINSKLQKNWTNFNKTPIIPCKRLLITLRYLGTGASFTSLGYSFRIGRSTVGIIVKETCTALWEKLQPIHMSQPTKNSFERIADEFWRLWNFPNCAGAIDGMHVRIKCPPHSGSMYYNYKKCFSLVLQGVADANCKFIAIEVGGYGKQSDGGTFCSSRLYQLMKTEQFLPPDTFLSGTEIVMPYVFVGDEAYPLLNNLLRPYSRRDCSPENEYFNSRLSRAGRCIECAFGIINAKWRLLWKPIETDPSLAELSIKAICILHNTIVDLEGIHKQMQEADDFINPNGLNKQHRPSNPINLKNGRLVRDAFRNFICRNKIQ